MSNRNSKYPLSRVPISLVRLWNQLLYLRYDPSKVIAVSLTVILAFLILAPIGAMITTSFHVQFRDQTRIGQSVGDLTLYYFKRVASSQISNLLFWTPLINTIVISFFVVAISLSLGILISWLIVRTDMPLSRWLAPALIIPYILPSWTFSLAWLTIFKNRRIAGVEGIAESFGFQPPDWLSYGMLPIIICLSFHYFPIVFLLFGSALRSLDSQLEETAEILNASRVTIIRKIIMPLMLPALMSAVLLVFSRAVGTFGTPYILGSPVRYDTLSTSLYGGISTGDTGVAAVLTGVMVILGISVVLIDSYMVRGAHRFITIGGKGKKCNLMPLGKFRTPATVFVFLVFLFTAIIPVAVLLISTLTRVPGVFTLENFTTEFWVGESIKINLGEAGLLRNPTVLKSLWNSLRIAGSAAIIAGLLGTFVGYIVAKFQTSPVAQYLRQVSFLPYLVPSIGFGAAYLTLFAVPRGPIPSLYGTLILVVIVMSIKYLPFASRAGISAMMQLGNEPEEAGMLVGAPWYKRLTRIVIPIQKGTLVVGILLPFISGMKELSLIVMLATPGTEFLTTQVMRYIGYNYRQLANGVTLIIVFIIILLTYVFQRLTGSTLAKGLGG